MDEITECPEGTPASSDTRGGAQCSSSSSSRPSGRKVSLSGKDGSGRRCSAQHQELKHSLSSPHTINTLSPVTDSGHAGDLGLPSRHRIQRSAVRPFLCCGSELSLVSLMDNLELSSKEQSNGASSLQSNYSLCDYEETSAEHLLPCSHSCSADLGSACAGSSSFSGGLSHSGTMVHRIKGDKHKPTSKRRFWSLRFRNKWPRGLRFTDSSRRMVCGCEDRGRCSAGGGEGVCEAGSCSNTVNISGHQAAVGKSRKGKVKARRASMVTIPCMSDFDRMFPINGNEEILARERAQEMCLAGDLEQRRLQFANRSDVRAMAFGASATSSAVGLIGSHSLGHLQSNPPEVASVEDSSSYSEFNPVVQWHAVDGGSLPRRFVVHTQMDYIHFLVPDLEEITNCSFYWGVIDRYEAERLLDKKREGTFLLRDSAQEDFLFSVSFRRYNRSLHARIEQWNNRFSFDVHDPAVFSSDSVCSLIEHYKDSSRCLFFEPMLTEPLHRNFPFSLQHLARAVICSNTSYDAVHQLPLPNSLKEYIRYYHYKQRVCVRRFECPE